jgi:hypothetical protein
VEWVCMATLDGSVHLSCAVVTMHVAAIDRPCMARLVASLKPARCHFGVGPSHDSKVRFCHLLRLPLSGWQVCSSNLNHHKRGT